jgi:hypothetical protein
MGEGVRPLPAPAPLGRIRGVDKSGGVCYTKEGRL